MKRSTALLIGLGLAVLASAAHAASFMDGFTDPSDGKFDVSHWLAEKKGFFPVPIIITEPAVGYGGGAALVFLHDPLSGKVAEGETYDPQAQDAKGRLIPPSISAVFGIYTQNETWMAGGAHLGVWKNDRIRYTGALMKGAINMNFYGLGVDGDNGVAFNLKTTLLQQGLKFRIRDSGLFAGISYLYLGTDAGFSLGGVLPPFAPKVTRSSRDAALTFSLQYDNRDTVFTPNRGLNASIQASLFRAAVGSDSEFERYRARLRWFTPLARAWVLGLRGEYEAVDGGLADIPFYHYPFVYLRGIPVMRYQGKGVAVAEAELRWNFTPRWSVVGFAGAGSLNTVVEGRDDAVVYSRGIGLRYFIARRFGLHVGLDVARGPEETALYLQVGHAWRF